MTPREIAAFNAGIAHAAGLAQTAAITIEIRADANHVRQQAAIEALRGLAEGLKAHSQIEAVRCFPADLYSGTGSQSDRTL